MNVAYDIVSASRPPPTLHCPALGRKEPCSSRNDRICLYMWFAFMIFKRFTGLLWASLGSLSGSWEVLGDPLGVLGRLLGVLESPCWSLGFALGVPGVLGGSSGGSRGSLGRGQKEPKTQKVLSERLGGALGGPWADFDCLGWSLDPAQGLQMLIFLWF